MNEQLSKGLDLLISHSQDTMALERLISAMEACLEGKQYDGSGDSLKAAVEARVHPLADYQITEKDVGSLVLFEDCGDDDLRIGRLDGYRGRDYQEPFKIEGRDCHWEHAEPHLDPIALHFRPFYATPDSVAPDDLGKHFAVLRSDGDVYVYNVGEDWEFFWEVAGHGGQTIIGYRPLKFVNPLKD